MIYNMCAGDMAVGIDSEERHVVVVLANGCIDMVAGPLTIEEARKVAAQALTEKYNAIYHKVEIRPLTRVAA